MRAERSLAVVRDIAVAFGLVGVVIGATFLYSGAWPPILVVESGSMMHCDPDPRLGDQCATAPAGVPYGRFGTIDPGDIVLQKRVTSRDEVRTWADGGSVTYGKTGDVIVYFPYNNTNATPIIHRAMAWVDIEDTRAGRVYRVHWVDGAVLEFNASGIYLPELGFDERAGFSPTNGYRPPIAGFITKGDNAITNDRADQAAANPEDRLAELVQVGWIVGKARGEVPWLGLVKLAFSPQINQANPAWIRLGNAYAPYDLWTMLGFSAVVVILTPLGVDVARAWREQRAIRRDLEKHLATEASRKGGDEPADETPAFEPEDAADDPPPFEPVERGARFGGGSNWRAP